MKQKSENRKQSSEHISEFRNRSENTKGITLIALIITIIVMLILVAVTVSVVVNSGLFKHASDAGEGWKQAQEKEQNIASGNIPVGDYSSIDEYISNNPVMKLKVGDYIDYKPDTAPDYSLTAAVSGADSEQTISQENLKWRVMNINSDGSVELVSEMPTTQAVTFKGALGCNNGVLVLNDICKKQYSNTSLGVTARSINLMDIEKHFTAEGLAARHAFKGRGGNIQYGNTKEYTGDIAQIPDIFENTGTTLADRTKDYYTEPTEATSSKKESITVTQTYYNLGETTPRSYLDDQTFYDMIFGAGTNYWLASRSAHNHLSNACFALLDMRSARLSGWDLFFSHGGENAIPDYLRPVVTLGSNIKISTTGGTADSPRTISL